MGSVGLKKREYCILNKQYTKAEYEKLRAQIIEQMHTTPYTDARGRIYRYGDFFPTEFSPFAYNISSAQEFLPLSESAAREQGFRWKSPERTARAITIPHDRIPDDSNSTPETTTKEVLGCAHRGECNDQCSVAFLITPNELGFYQRLRLPLPDLCPNCRHYERVARRNPHKLWSRRCMCIGKTAQTTETAQTYTNAATHFHGANHCPNDFETSYAPDRPEIVYCEQCYNAEVA